MEIPKSLRKLEKSPNDRNYLWRLKRARKEMVILSDECARRVIPRKTLRELGGPRNEESGSILLVD